MSTKLLFIDDDRAIRKLVGGYFSDLGYQVLLAEDGEQGLLMYREQQPDIILVDLRMPKVDGFEVLTIVHKESPDLPLLVISGEGEMADVIQALRLGAWNYHTKPITSLSLIRHSVEQALDKANLIKENKCYQQGLEHKLATIIENFPGFIYTVNNDCQITYMNQLLIDYIGEHDENTLCHKALWGFDTICEWCPMRFSLKEKVGKVELQSPRDNRWFHLIYFPLFDTNNEISEVQGVVYDITEHKQAQISMEEREEHLRKENLRLRGALTDRYKFGNIIGKSNRMQEVYETISNAAGTDASVIIYGESGTGKELVAQAIHDYSDRKNQQLVYVNCGAIPETLIESEFFGYKKGAFSGAVQDKHGFLDIADQGTIFLDEVGEISLNMQIKLLRAIEGNGYTPVGDTQTKYPDIRIIAATNRDLKQLVKDGIMRQDFLYRIHIIPIHLPPLRERKGDIGLLVEHFLGGYEHDTFVPLSLHHTTAMETYDWPGNVRELQNTLHRYVTLGKLDFMGEELTENTDTSLLTPSMQAGDRPLSEILEEVERRVLLDAYTRHHFHQGKTATALKVDRKTLYRKMKHLGIEKPA